MKPYHVHLLEGRVHLSEAGIDTAALDARVLIQFASGLHHEELVLARDRYVEESIAKHYRELIAERARRVPLAYLTGEKEFWGRKFRVSSDVLVPRPESEHLIEEALKLLPRGGAARVLDLGTGSGALLVTLLAECPALFGVGVDCSHAAIKVARGNATAHGVSARAALVCADWAAPLEARFELVVANPPYLAAHELETAQAEVAFEPRAALDGGADGLAAYRAILAQARAFMAPGGYVLFEVGAFQGAAVQDLLHAAGAALTQIRRDLAGHERVVIAEFPQQS